MKSLKSNNQKHFDCSLHLNQLEDINKGKCPCSPMRTSRLKAPEKMCEFTHERKKDHRSTKLGNSFSNVDLADVTTRHIWPQRRLCAAGSLREMKGCNPRLKYVARPVLSMRRWIGFSLPQTVQRPKDLPSRLGGSHAFYNFNWIS